MSLHDQLIFGIRRVFSAGVELVNRSALEFVGATVEDDPVNKRTKVTFSPAALPAGASNQLLQHDGVDWKAVSGIDAARITTGGLPAIRGGTGYSGYAVGDLLFGASPILLGRLAVGAAGKVVRSNGTLPVYEYLSTLHNAAGTNLVQVGGSAAPATGQLFALTDDGGYAIRMTNRTGGVSLKGELVMVYDAWRVTGETVPGQLSAMSCAGATMTNTDKGRLYLKVVDAGADNTVEVYKDSGRTSKVASGTDTGKAGGALTLAAFGGSGLTVTVTSVAGALADATPMAEIGYGASVKSLATAPSGVLGKPVAGVVYSAGVADGADVWVVVAGRAYVLTTAGACAGGYLMTQFSASAAVCTVEQTADFASRGIGRALERVTSGLVLAQLELRGIGPAV